MMRNYLFIICLLISTLSIGCIGDDIVFDTVEPVIRISNAVDSIAQDSQYQFKNTYFNNVGQEEFLSDAVWTSSAPDIIAITSSGLATALQPGESNIKVNYTTSDGISVSDEQRVVVGENTVIVEILERTGTIKTTSSYTLTGDFILKEEGPGLKLSFSDNYRASSNLPGLYIYVTNNPNTTNQAIELGKVTTFNGAHTYDLPESIKIDDYKYLLYFCKPFNVKVGDGELSEL